MTEDEFADYLTAQYAEHPRPDPDHLERALVLLGLAAPGGYATSESIARRVELVTGLYRWDTRDVVIIDHGRAADDIAPNVTLVHELVHALQDREVDLRAYTELHSMTDDSHLAALSIIEGEATLHGMRYAASLLGINPAEVDWARRTEAVIALDDEWAVTQSSPYPASYGSFPYAYGSRFVRFAWEATGLEGVRALIAAPPPNTHMLMGSTIEPIEALPPLEIAAPVPPVTWTLASEYTLGAWGLFLPTRQAESREWGHELAVTWRADNLAVYVDTSAPPDTAAVWTLETADDVWGSEVQAALARSLPGARVRRTGTRITVAIAHSGALIDWAE
jgi:hypothetical protein